MSKPSPSLPQQQTLALQWDTEIEARPDGSFLVRPVKPVRQRSEEAQRELTTEEAARRLRLSERTLRLYAETGEIFGYKPGRRGWLFALAAVKVYRRFQTGAISRDEMEQQMDEIREAYQAR